MRKDINNRRPNGEEKNSTFPRLVRKDKDDKRRIQLIKQAERKEARIAKYGSSSVTAVASDMNRRFVAAFLALVFALSCLVLGVNFATKAEDSKANLTPTNTMDNTSGLVLNKYLTPNKAGNYDLTMEAYTTADEVSITEKIPTDFVVVVDQSGSMSTSDMPTGTPTINNNLNLETVANGSYYIKDGDNYYRVYGVKDYLYRYYAANYWYVGSLVDRFGTDLHWGMSNTESTTTFENQMYFREVVNGVTYYQPITMTVQGKLGTYYIKFKFDSKQTNSTYWFDRDVTTHSSNGNSPWYRNVITGAVMQSGTLWSAANAAVQTLYPDDNAYTYSEVNVLFSTISTGMYVNYPMYDRKVGYTRLCYRDINGIEHEVASNNNGATKWEFCNANGQAITTNSGSTRPTYSGLYTFSNTTTRLEALKTALNEFAQAVADETDYFGSVDNKISIVGFSSPNTSSYTYNNTELLTGENLTISGTDGVQMTVATDDDYKTALVAATNGTAGTVNNKITDAITALTAYGGTQPENGLNMAYQILTKRNTTKYTLRSGANKGSEVDRHKIVIYFTDGQPGNYHYSDQYEEANDVIEAALPIKQYGASLFSIGVFGESDGNPLTYTHATATNSSGEDPYWKYLGGWVESYHDTYYPYTWYCLRREWRPGTDGYTPTANDTIYDYMSVTSSNYPDAEEYIAPAWLEGSFSGDYIGATETIRHSDTAEDTNKYYRMASNQETLVAAFLQAVTMHNDDLDPTTVRIGSTSVLKDYINTSDFIVNSNYTVTYETEDETMINGVITPVENSRQEISGLTTDFNNNLLTVSGYDYTAHYISEGRQGQKLIITIHDIYPVASKTSELDVLYSNTESSGIYDESDALVLAFPRPSISRHSYTLNVGEENINGKFDMVSSIVDSSGAVVAKDNPVLANVIVVDPSGNRTLYKNSGGTSVAQSGDRDVFYYENVPAGYQVKTAVKSTDDTYTYKWTDNTDVTLDQTTAQSKNYSYEDSNIYITSEANNRQAVVTMTIKGVEGQPDYSDKTKQFPITLSLTKNGNAYAETSIADATIIRQDGTTETVTLNFANGSCSTYTVGGKTENLTLANGEQVVFDAPAGYTLTVTEGDHEKYTLTYKTSDNATPGDSNNAVVINEVPNQVDVINTLTENPDIDSGVLDSSNPLSKLLFVMAGMCGIAALAFAIYEKKKKVF